MSKEEKEMSLEQSFLEIEKAISQLEEEDISLEDSFQMYTRGMELLKQCNDKIDQVEKQVLVLEGDGELHEF